MVPLVYDPRYNITAWGLERLHPFDSQKYQRIYYELIRRGLRKKADFVRPVPVRRSDLLKVHSPAYLQALGSAASLAKILEVPIAGYLPAWLLDRRVLRPMRFASGGTILACRLALESGVAINLGGGYHHAARDWGGGFCVYADIPLAAAILHEEGRVRIVLVVDLDAHQGNGIASVFQNWPWAFLCDLYEEDIFPSIKEPEDYPLPVPAGLAGSEYLEIVATALPPVMDKVKPDLLIYNAGADPLMSDPLARFRLTRNDLAERDLMVVSLARERSIPVAMTLSGGYASESWQVQTDAIEGLLTRFDRH